MKYLLRTSLAIAALMLGGVAMAGAIEVDIVDNEDLGDGATAFGPWSTSSAAGFCGKNSVFSNDSKKPATFRFESDLPTAKPGIYLIYVKWTYHPNRSSAVPYTVNDDLGAGATLAPIDQNTGGQFVPDCGVNGNTWVQLLGPAQGAFECGVENDCAVTVSAAGGQASADAVKWDLIEAFPPPPAKPTSCPCSEAYTIAAGALIGIENAAPVCANLGDINPNLVTDGVAGRAAEKDEDEGEAIFSIIGLKLPPFIDAPACVAIVRTIEPNEACDDLGVVPCSRNIIETTLDVGIRGLTEGEVAGCQLKVEKLAPMMGCVDLGPG